MGNIQSTGPWQKERNSPGKLIVVFYEETGLIISERAVIFYTGCNPRVVSSPTVSWSCQEFLSYPALWLVTWTPGCPLIGRWLPSIPVIQTCHFLAWQSTLTSHNAALASYCQLFRKKCFIKNPLPHSPHEFSSSKLNSAPQMSWKNLSLCKGWGAALLKLITCIQPGFIHIMPLLPAMLHECCLGLADSCVRFCSRGYQIFSSNIS